MSFEVPGHQLGQLTAGADLSGAQFTFVKVSSAGQIIQCSVSGEAALGVLQNKPSSGQAADVDRTGVSKVLMSTTVTAGGKVTTAADGTGCAGGASDYGNGTALEAGVVSGLCAVAQKYPGK